MVLYLIDGYLDCYQGADKTFLLHNIHFLTENVKKIPTWTKHRQLSSILQLPKLLSLKDSAWCILKQRRDIILEKKFLHQPILYRNYFIQINTSPYPIYLSVLVWHFIIYKYYADV